MPSVTLGTVTPILRIFDEAKALEFYVDFLGFEEVFRHRFEPDLPLYMGIRHGTCELHLTEHHGDATPGAAVRIACSDLDAYCAILGAKHYRYVRPAVEVMPWGSREMSVRDPFGNRLTFTTNAPEVANPAFEVTT